MSAPTDPVTRELVAADLRAVIGRCRSLGDFDNLVTPALDELVRIAGGERRDLPNHLAAAVGTVEDERYRRFLEILLPLPFRPGSPWPQLGSNRSGAGRGEEAARQAFDLSWDACNRSGQMLDGRSRREWAELLLADSLRLELDDAHRARVDVGAETGTGINDPGVGGSGPDAEVEGVPGRGRRRWGLVAAVLVALSVVGIVAGLKLGGRAPGGSLAAPVASTTSAVRCGVPASLDADLAGSPDAARVRSGLEDLLGQVGGTGRIGCALGPARRWQDVVVEEHDSGEDGLPGALVLAPSHQGLYLSPEAYATYRRLGGGDGSFAQKIGGIPDRVDDFADGHSEVTLSKGVVLVEGTAGAPYFWIAAPYVAWWRAHPELGLPTSNPMPDLSQDFEHGRVLAIGSDTGGPKPLMSTNPGAALPAARAGHILRQSDGTSWWIDDRDRRWWIATGGVWTCLGGASVALPDEVSGDAIATLPFAGHATCPR